MRRLMLIMAAVLACGPALAQFLNPAGIQGYGAVVNSPTESGASSVQFFAADACYNIPQGSYECVSPYEWGMAYFNWSTEDREGYLGFKMQQINDTLTIPPMGLPNGNKQCPIATKYVSQFVSRIGGLGASPSPEFIYVNSDDGNGPPSAVLQSAKGMYADDDIAAIVVTLTADCSAGKLAFPVLSYDVAWSYIAGGDQTPAPIYKTGGDFTSQLGTFNWNITNSIAVNIAAGASQTMAWRATNQNGQYGESSLTLPNGQIVVACQDYYDDCFPGWSVSSSEDRVTSSSISGPGSAVYYPMMFPTGKSSYDVYSNISSMTAWDADLYISGGENGPVTPIPAFNTWQDDDLDAMFNTNPGGIPDITFTDYQETFDIGSTCDATTFLNEETGTISMYNYYYADPAIKKGSLYYCGPKQGQPSAHARKLAEKNTIADRAKNVGGPALQFLPATPAQQAEDLKMYEDTILASRRMTGVGAMHKHRGE